MVRKRAVEWRHEGKGECSKRNEAKPLNPLVVAKFIQCIRNENCGKLTKMLNKHPEQLILQGWDRLHGSALHTAVLQRSKSLVTKVLKGLNDMQHGDNSATVLDFVSKVDGFHNLTAIDMAYIVGGVDDFLEEAFDDLQPRLYHTMSLGLVGMKSRGGALVWEEDTMSLGPVGMKSRGRAPMLEEEFYKSESKPSPELEESKEWVAELRQLLKPVLSQTAPDIFQDNYGIYLKDNGEKKKSWIDIIADCEGFSHDLTRFGEFCLHAVATRDQKKRNDALNDGVSIPLFDMFVQHLYEKLGNNPVLMRLLIIRDEQGRTPLHISMDGNGNKSSAMLLEQLLSLFPDLDPNVTDFMGRTPLHWAAAQGLTIAVDRMIENKKTLINATFDATHCYYLSMDNEKRNPRFEASYFLNVTPLHLAVIHNHVSVVDALLKSSRSKHIVNSICYRGISPNSAESVYYGRSILVSNNVDRTDSWTPFQLAAYMGHVRILRLLLKDNQLYDPGLKKIQINIPKDHNNVSALHIAAARFHPSAIKALLESGLVNIFVRDKNGNTALHYLATMAGEELAVAGNLYDYVSRTHFRLHPPNESRKWIDHDIETSINLLMQFGLDMQQKNKFEDTPTLSSSSPQCVRRWWAKKMTIEMQEDKTNLNTAANAISVNTALVATASFVGPLQPPLGLSNDESSTWLRGYSQVNNPAVEAFLICDCFSFYLAIATIVFAMLPSWPIPHEGLSQEVRIARRCVQVAVILLLHLSYL